MSSAELFVHGTAGEGIGGMRGVPQSFSDWAGAYCFKAELVVAISAYKAYCEACSAVCGSTVGVGSSGVVSDVESTLVVGDRGACQVGLGVVGEDEFGVGAGECVASGSRSSVLSSGVECARLPVGGDVRSRENILRGGDFVERRPVVERVRSGVVGPRLAALESVGNGRLPRGPNFLRNHENRLKKKESALRRQAAYLQSEGVNVLNVGRRPQRTDAEQELHDLKVARQIIQEKRKLDKLQSPTQMIEDAMRQVAMAERCAKLANDSKVAKWAADLSSASAESIARSAGADVRTLKSGSSAVRSAGVAAPVSSSFVGETSFSESDVLVSAYGVSSGKHGKKPKEEKKEEKKLKVVHAPGLVSNCFEIDLESGRSINSDGDAYNRVTAGRWVGRYQYLEKYIRPGVGHEQLAKDSKTSLTEIRKYFRLKAEFKL